MKLSQAGQPVSAASSRLRSWLPAAVTFTALLGIAAATPVVHAASRVFVPQPSYCVQCILPDNGGGSGDMPPAGCTYDSPAGGMQIANGLPPGTTIDTKTTLHSFFNVTRTPGGSLGGEVQQYTALLGLLMTGKGSLAGFNRSLQVQVGVETHSAPVTPGDPVQTFATAMPALDGALFGDPDFCTLVIRGGGSAGGPHAGSTTLTRLPSGDFAVDSFFDISYEIDFVGCPGSALDGFGGSSGGSIVFQAGSALDICDDLNPCTDDSCDSDGFCLNSSNSAPCDDGLFCTDPDICAGGICESGAPRDCDDGRSCTDDSCDEAADLCRNRITGGAIACNHASAVTWLNSNATIDSGADLRPFIASDGAGDWMAAWHSRDTLGGLAGSDWDVLFSTSTDNGVTWSFPALIDAAAGLDNGGDARVKLANDGAGRWIAVWASRNSFGGTIRNDFDILYSVTTNLGSTWTAAAPLNSNAPGKLGADNLPDIATDGAGTWIAAWHSLDPLGGAIGADLDILYSRSTNGGATWSPVAPLNSNAGTDSGTDNFVDIEAGPGGTWMATWQSKESLGGTIGTDSDIFFATSTNGGTSWSVPAPVNSFAPAPASRDRFPRLAVDSSGTWMTVWASKATLGGTLGSDFDVFVAVSTNAGSSWSTAAPLNSTAAGPAAIDSFPTVETDHLGTWLAAWYSADSLGGTIGSDNDILCSFSSDAGATWTGAAPLHSNAGIDSGSDRFVNVASDRGGVFIAAWQSNDVLAHLGSPVGPDNDIFTSANNCDCAPTTTTTTSTTSTTTSTTSSTTVPGPEPLPCELGREPTCDGFCPDPTEICVPTGAGCFCETLDPIPCGDMAPAPECLGFCPPPLSCVSGGPTGCDCAPNPLDTVLCGDAAAPTCEGGCTYPGEACIDLGGVCACIPSPAPCGVFEQAPLCYGDCPPLQACTFVEPADCVCAEVSSFPRTVPPGEDCFLTECPSGARFSFCDTPIPPDFFGPGSDPFDGAVAFGGTGSGVDTVVQRLAPMVFTEPFPVMETVPIEIVALDLVDCAPITVTFNGGQQPTLWDVTMGLSPNGAAPTGLTEVIKQHANGGVFTSGLQVQPRFTFTNVDVPSQVLELDTALLGMPPVELAAPGWFGPLASAPWSHGPPGFGCGSDFVPGLEQGPGPALSECCRPIMLTSPGALGASHTVFPPTCPPCAGGACCDPSGPLGICTIAADAASCGGDYKGDGTTCFDTDGDGIADVFETGDCSTCALRSPCATGTDPHNADTDGDGVDDGDELLAGTDPCVSDIL